MKALALVNALDEAAKPTRVAGRLKARLNTPLKGIKAGAEFAGAKLSGELTLESAQKSQAETALLFSSLLGALCAKRPVLLLVDEAQALARSRDNELVATAFRTAITLNRDKLRVVFAGSSRTQLASVFSNASAPLYSSGVAITDFPLLDRNFIEFVLAHRGFPINGCRTLPLPRAGRVAGTQSVSGSASDLRSRLVWSPDGRR